MKINFIKKNTSLNILKEIKKFILKKKETKNYFMILKNNIYIIAEVGVNHNGDLKLAKKLIIAAKKVGANAVKFQNFSADKLATRNSKKLLIKKKILKKRNSTPDVKKIGIKN